MLLGRASTSTAARHRSERVGVKLGTERAWEGGGDGGVEAQRIQR